MSARDFLMGLGARDTAYVRIKYQHGGSMVDRFARNCFLVRIVTAGSACRSITACVNVQLARNSSFVPVHVGVRGMCPDLGAEFPYETFRSCSQKSYHKMTTLARVGGPFTNPIPFLSARVSPWCVAH